jgi:hypothetical protein
MFKLNIESIHRGFQIEFENNYTISVQFGPGTHSENGNKWPAHGVQSYSSNAECAVLKPDGGFMKTPWNEEEEVIHHLTPKEVLKVMNWVAAL